MSSEIAVIEVDNLSKRYEVYATPGDRLKEFLISPLIRRYKNFFDPKEDEFHYYRNFWALEHINFSVEPGETLGIIGRNGSGKSTLLQILAGTLSATFGQATVRGRVAALLELGSGFNPEFTGRENVYLNGQILGLTRKEVEERFEAITEFADIGDFIDQPVKTYSSGMFVRLAFAVQAHIDADVVIIDEALAVGDIFFRQKCYARLDYLRERGAAVILVSHAMSEIEQFCRRAIILDHGRLIFEGSSSEAAKHYYLLNQSPAKSTANSQAGPAVEGDVSNVLNTVSLAASSQESALHDVTQLTQIGSGAKCLQIGLTDVDGKPMAMFRQGDLAIFTTLYEVSDTSTVPIPGVLIKNDRGIIVHGKNSWQFDDCRLEGEGVPSRVWSRQEVRMDLAPGEYVFEVGLVSVPQDLWDRRTDVSHAEMAAQEYRLCHVPDAGVFSVAMRLDGHTSKLTHHGVADLAGSVRVVLNPSS
jgi:lipopolysaccharide transport system ATP-binding protein